MLKIQKSLEEKIIDMYDSGFTYKEIEKELKTNSSVICKLVKGRATISERRINCLKRGRYSLSEEGRKKLSENGKKSCQKTGKVWTKPEKEFHKILNEIGIGVKFPDEIKEIFNIKDDKNPIIYFQYLIQRYICDFVYPENKIIFRVQGDFWHSNPLLYKEEDLTKIQKYNKIRDKNKKTYLEKYGWEVIDVWESDIYWRKDYVIKKAIGAVGSISGLHPEGPQFDPGIAYSNKEWSQKLKDIWFKKSKGRPKKQIKIKECLVCKKEFEVKKIGKDRETKYCSCNCYNINRRKVKNRPSKEQLLKEIKETNYCVVGRKYGVSDNAVRKWLK